MGWPSFGNREIYVKWVGLDGAGLSRAGAEPGGGAWDRIRLTLPHFQCRVERFGHVTRFEVLVEAAGGLLSFKKDHS